MGTRPDGRASACPPGCIRCLLLVRWGLHRCLSPRSHPRRPILGRRLGGLRGRVATAVVCPGSGAAPLVAAPPSLALGCGLLHLRRSWLLGLCCCAFFVGSAASFVGLLSPSNWCGWLVSVLRFLLAVCGGMPAGELIGAMTFFGLRVWEGNGR